eukprot:4114363-Prymnesium_polylepis.1
MTQKKSRMPVSAFMYCGLEFSVPVNVYAPSTWSWVVAPNRITRGQPKSGRGGAGGGVVGGEGGQEGGMGGTGGNGGKGGCGGGKGGTFGGHGGSGRKHISQPATST